MLNPMHRPMVGRPVGNKLTVRTRPAIGRKCSFCDVNLATYRAYDLAATDVLVDRVEGLIRETGQTGISFCG